MTTIIIKITIINITILSVIYYHPHTPLSLSLPLHLLPSPPSQDARPPPSAQGVQEEGGMGVPKTDGAERGAGPVAV
eukprot:1124871-Pyramimonas_sp.AAC.1